MVVTLHTKWSFYVFVGAIVAVIVLFWLGLRVYTKTVDRNEGFSLPAVVTWKSTGGIGRTARIGSDGSIYSVGINDTLMSYDGTKWNPLGASFRDISVRNKNQVIGFTRTFMIYKTDDITATPISWVRLNNSRFEHVSVGTDGTIWATVLPVGGTYGIYSYDGQGAWNRVAGSMRKVALRTKNEAWGIAGDDTVWHYQAGSWSQINGALRHIAVGSDGDVWGINKDGVLSHRSKQGEWQQASGTYKSVDVKDASMIITTDTSDRVLIGSPKDIASVVDPVETPFDIFAYSGGSNSYSEFQKSAVGWAALYVNGIKIVDQDSSAFVAPQSGLNVVTINEDGNPLYTAAFDTGRDQSASDSFALLLKNISTSQKAPLDVNVYTIDSKISRDNNNQIVFSSKTVETIAVASITPGKYDISFSYTGDGTCLLSTAGVAALTSAITLTASKTSQDFNQTVTFGSVGTHSLLLQCITSSAVRIKNLSLSPNSDSSYPPAMMFILASNDAGSKLSSSAIKAVNAFGGTSLADLKVGGSYYLVYDFINGRLIDEQLSNSGHVRFVSQGKYPVFDSTYKTDSSNVVFMMNRDTVIGYDINAANVISTTMLGKTALPQPFSSQVDTVINIGMGKSLVLTRGQFCISVKPDFSSIIAGPDIIGSQLLPINIDPFTSGINANTSTLDGNRYFFKDKNFLQTTDAMDRVITTGLLGTGDFSGLPKTFTRIHAAFPIGNDIGLVSYDKFVSYNPISKAITSGPVDILSDQRFIGLPIGFKVGSAKAAVPFLNHTRFRGQRLLNYDISVKMAPGMPGWSPESFTIFNKDVVTNLIMPPIKVKSLIDKYPDILKQYGSDDNTILTTFEKYASINGWTAPRYGGNTVSFALINKKSSMFCSYSNSGIGYKNAQFKGGEWYTLSIWVKTEDTGLSVGAVTGSPITGKLTPPNNVILDVIKIDASKGWQLLSWEFHHPSFSSASDVSFNLSQDSTVDTLHTLYGPVLKGVIVTADKDYIDDLVKQSYFYIFNNTAAVFIGYNASGLYSVKNVSTSTAMKGQYERFCAFHTEDSATIFLSSYAAVNKGSLNLYVNSGKLAVGPVDDPTAKWVVLRQGDSSSQIMFVNQSSDLMLSVASDGSLSVSACPQSVKTALTNGFSIKLPSVVESFESSTAHIQAAASRDPIASSEVFLFRDGVVCSYDVVNDALLAPPSQLTEHSAFQNLPTEILHRIDSAFNYKSNEIVIFSGNRFLCWNVSTGVPAEGMRSSAELGPGGHPLFHRLPAPFNKQINGAAKLDMGTVLFISQNNFMRWDLVNNVPLDDPQPITSGVLSQVVATMTEPINTMVDVPGMNGQVFFIGETSALAYDVTNSKLVAGPDIIGPSGNRFTSLIPPFIPSAAEVCQSYQSLISLNTDFPKQACVNDLSRPFQWQDDCMFSTVPTCSDAGGIWNDVAGFCGSKVSNGTVPLKSTDASKRQATIAKYLQDCKTISEWDYQDMKRVESGKQDSATKLLSQEKQTKQAILKKMDNARTNLQQINKQLQDAQLTLNADTDKACHPLKVCLKGIDASRGRKIPLSCNQSVLTNILQKDTMSPDDITTILNVVAKTNIINSYPIENHPDYPKYVQTNQVHQCMPDLHRKTITDYPLSSFPSYNNYISSDILLPLGNTQPTSAQQSSSNSLQSTSPGTVQSAPDVQTNQTSIVTAGTLVQTVDPSQSQQVDQNRTVPSSSNLMPNNLAVKSSISSPDSSTPSNPISQSIGSVRSTSSLQNSSDQTVTNSRGQSAANKVQPSQDDFFISNMLTPDVRSLDPRLVSKYHTFIDGIIQASPQASNSSSFCML